MTLWESMVKAVIVELHGDNNSGDVVRYTVADSPSISKGTLCKLATPNTASAGTGSGEAFAGIASTDKEANDGSTTLGFFTNGIFDIQESGNSGISAGDIVVISGADLIRKATSGDLLTGAAIGKALEDASVDEVITVKVGGF